MSNYPYETPGKAYPRYSPTDLGGTLSPLIIPTNYKGVVPDFGVTPTTDGTKGWGKPFKNADGTPRPEGTLGGDYITRVLHKRDNEWKLYHSQGGKVFGEVDWKGAKVDGRPLFLTFHGTTGRHVHDGFKYGSDPKHNRVYMSGAIVALSPLPVLGAALVEYEPERYLVVVAGMLGNEVEFLYQRLLQPMPPSYVEANAETLKRRFNDVYPLGWKSAGVANFVTPDELLAPTTPMFASENGLKWAQARRTVVKFFDGFDDVQQLATNILAVSLSLSSTPTGESLNVGVPTCTGAEKRIKHRVWANKVVPGITYSTPSFYVTVTGTPGQFLARMSAAQYKSLVRNACPPWSIRELSDYGYFSNYQIGSPIHNWITSRIDTAKESKGSLVFGVDFIGNQQVDIMLTQDSRFNMGSRWAIGVDGVVKYGSYSNQKLIDAPNGNHPNAAAGFNNSTPTVLQYYGIDTYAIVNGTTYPDASTAPTSGITTEERIAGIVGRRSDGISASKGTGSADNWRLNQMELAFNSQDYSVTTNQWLGEASSSQFRNLEDGTTVSGMYLDIQVSIEYVYGGVTRKVQLERQAPQTAAQMDAGAGFGGLVDSMAFRRAQLHYLDIRQESPFAIRTVVTNDCVVAVSNTHANGSTGLPSSYVKGEKTVHVVATIPGRSEEVKHLVQDAEAISIDSTKRLWSGWSFYPLQDRPAYTSSVTWPGEPSPGVQPPMTVAQSFKSDNQPRTYGMSVSAGLFAAGESMFHDARVAFRHHTFAFGIHSSNLGYLGWRDAPSPVEIPAVLNQPMANTVFDWDVKYQSTDTLIPDQSKDKTTRYPKLETFYEDSAIFESSEIDFEKVASVYSTHLGNSNGDSTISATTDGKEYLYSIVVKRKNGEEVAFSYFTGTSEPIKTLFPLAERFYNLSVL